MPVHREHCDVQRGIGNARVWFEDGEYSQQSRQNEKGLLSEAKAEASDVAADMQPEDTQEESSEGVEHFDEEIPPQSHIRCEIGQQELDAIC